jgi:hypothetical protein
VGRGVVESCLSLLAFEPGRLAADDRADASRDVWVMREAGRAAGSAKVAGLHLLCELGSAPCVAEDVARRAAAARPGGAWGLVEVAEGLLHGRQPPGVQHGACRLLAAVLPATRPADFAGDEACYRAAGRGEPGEALARRLVARFSQLYLAPDSAQVGRGEGGCGDGDEERQAVCAALAGLLGCSGPARSLAARGGLLEALVATLHDRTAQLALHHTAATPAPVEPAPVPRGAAGRARTGPRARSAQRAALGVRAAAAAEAELNRTLMMVQPAPARLAQRGSSPYPLPPSAAAAHSSAPAYSPLCRG